MTPWVRVVIVNYNGAGRLQRVVEALTAQTDHAFECVIVDNASTDGSADRLCLPDQRFSMIRANANLGFAAGCNRGARDARTPWLAMLNPDAYPGPDWLAVMRAATRTHPRMAWFGSTQVWDEDPDILDGAGDNLSIYGIAWRGGFGGPTAQVSGDTRCFAPCAAAALYRSDIFEALGGFAEDFFCYLEDVDLGFRLNLIGHAGLQLAAARVRHEGSAITGRYSPFTIHHSCRNGLMMLLRCMPGPLLALAVPLYLLAQLWLGLRTRTVRVRRIAIAEAAHRLPILLSQRRQIQARRRIGWLAVARLLAWSPLTVSRRAILPLRQS